MMDDGERGECEILFCKIDEERKNNKLENTKTF